MRKKGLLNIIRKAKKMIKKKERDKYKMMSPEEKNEKKSQERYYKLKAQI